MSLSLLSLSLSLLFFFVCDYVCACVCVCVCECECIWLFSKIFSLTIEKNAKFYFFYCWNYWLVWHAKWKSWFFFLIINKNLNWKIFTFFKFVPSISHTKLALNHLFRDSLYMIIIAFTFMFNSLINWWIIRQLLKFTPIFSKMLLGVLPKSS